MGTDSDLFLEPLPEYLTCQVCMNALSGAYSWCQQDHLTCRRCFHDATKQREINRQPLRCPSCRSKANPKLCVAISRIVGELQMRCKYSKRGGCEWTGNVSDYAEHFAKCDCKPEACSNAGEGCDFVGTETENEDHLANECEHARMTCPRDGCEMQYVRSFSEIHDQICTHYKCTVEGCETITKRTHLLQHEFGCRARAEELREADMLMIVARKTINELKAELDKIRKAEETEEDCVFGRSDLKKRKKCDDEYVQPPWARAAVKV